MKTYEVDGNDFTIKDLSNFFFQTRGFPSILSLGKCSGEGQTGGRYITELAQELEKRIVDDLGDEEYTKQMDKLMDRDRDNENGGLLYDNAYTQLLKLKGVQK